MAEDGGGATTTVCTQPLSQVLIHRRTRQGEGGGQLQLTNIMKFTKISGLSLEKESYRSRLGGERLFIHNVFCTCT